MNKYRGWILILGAEDKNYKSPMLRSKIFKVSLGINAHQYIMTYLPGLCLSKLGHQPK